MMSGDEDECESNEQQDSVMTNKKKERTEKEDLILSKPEEKN